MYRTFVLEEKHGFNKQTGGFYAKDQLKKFLVGQIVQTPILAGIIKIVHWGVRYFPTGPQTLPNSSMQSMPVYQFGRSSCTFYILCIIMKNCVFSHLRNWTGVNCQRPEISLEALHFLHSALIHIITTYVDADTSASFVNCTIFSCRETSFLYTSGCLP